jgi:hypothetical protein
MRMSFSIRGAQASKASNFANALGLPIASQNNQASFRPSLLSPSILTMTFNPYAF